MKQNGHYFTDDILKCNFMKETFCILIQIVHNGPDGNKTKSIQVMIWRRAGDKPLREQMLSSPMAHIYSTRGVDWRMYWWTSPPLAQPMASCLAELTSRYMNKD